MQSQITKASLIWFASAKYSVIDGAPSRAGGVSHGCHREPNPTRCQLLPDTPTTHHHQSPQNQKAPTQSQFSD